MKHPATRQTSPHSPAPFWLAIGYAALIIYGTLFPLDEWRFPPAGWINPITLGLPAHVPRADLVVNLLAYMPLGLFLTLWLRHRLGWVLAMTVACAIGVGMSLALEILQSALPSRVPSRLDWLSNSAGTVAGALFGLAFNPRLPVGHRFATWRETWFVAGALGNLALIVLAFWTMTQLVPFVPSFDWGNLKAGMKPLGNTLRHPDSLRIVATLEAWLNLLALGLLAQLAARRSVVWPFLLFALAVLVLKIPVEGRQLTLELLLGWAAAAASLVILRLTHPRSLALGVIAGLVTAYALAQFEPGPTATTRAINWTPFAAQVGSLAGMGDLVDTLWPFLALGLAGRWLTPWRLRRLVWGLGGTLTIALAFGLEWMQQAIPGRHPDITDVLIAALGWTLPWLFTDTRGQTVAARIDGLPRQARWALPVLASGMLSLGAVGWSIGSAVQIETDERGRAMLPAPESLAPIHFPNYRLNHPRLPHPGTADIARLRIENPGWFGQMQRRARRGEGDLYAITVLAYIEPGSQDLARLHARLMQVRYSFRGEQAKPVALAYDWLYEQWSDAQRAQLRDKLAEGVGYLVNFIRRERLSPYNVYLYNSPFQALMAASIALYGDDPRGELYMRFTHDLWKHRVLPVWRQVMGQGGGWHEGGEYVGIGIGQAIYQVPAMWRAATGEDLFKSEPGIRGFLDFAVYRKQPDGTDFRWGDAGFFNRGIPDLNALALEYRHAAAYSLRPPRRGQPTSWPWGPLSDASLLEPQARARLPLTKRFDGIGMVIARSDWSADATYVSFKAGDNYWSHSHLDQGAFSLHKRGGLALDSGLYGPKYGSDHHMNYTYQSIAHNLVTITDPDDTALSDGKIVRRIANDGGQRRVGSGWGLSAPVDLSDWLDQRRLYHTGRIAAYAEAADHVVAVADVTPAYTNPASGAGEFSHRTRRVERLWRSFVYDRAADLVIVFDVVDASRPEFEKRWLLHTTGKPDISGTRFRVDTGRPGGGHLQGEVLLPRAPRLNAIGGPGFEFWVDGRNYDESGAVAKALARRGQPAEPGNWRIELMPASPSKPDQFLVVLAPRRDADEPVPRLRLLQQGRLVGVEIAQPDGPRRWWFDPDNGDVHFEDASERRSLAGGLHATAPGWLPGWADSVWRTWFGR
ncbi:MAG: hypothetical protein B7Y26_01740 [Hydrogenophilales bacterium 16-64-46]|nr:MAG: hypothetical protein B7Z32_01440 [Hydrogenophilales bacterium 12-64-13]OYZ06555.1 MAG: hypothetical protein B7Y26_01740 [Hydrogenophilales bacterium 16-64-46]OZA39263.1 MAG: hypothetical protein B7X87_02845 [Hydrogenophilales bacterium 17-64-34]HQS98817.1 VanZ family protein [Thiobacillus sp.]